VYISKLYIILAAGQIDRLQKISSKYLTYQS